MSDLSPFDQVGIWGAPFHGLVRSGVLTLGNGEQRAAGMHQTGLFRMRVPGVAEPIRTEAEQALDESRGFSWPVDVVLHASGRGLTVHGSRQHYANTLYSISPGNVWSVKLPFDMSFAGGASALANPAELLCISRLSDEYQARIEVPVVLLGFTPQDMISSINLQTVDMLPDGSQSILSQFDLGGPNAFYLLRVSGKGTDEAPFSVRLELLCRYGTYESGGFDDSGWQVEGYYHNWELSVEEEEIPGTDEQCPDLRVSWTGSNLVLSPAPLPVGGTHSHVTSYGVRTSEVRGLVIGYWFDEQTPTPVRVDIHHRLTQSRANYSGQGSGTPKISEFQRRYDETQQACVLGHETGGQDAQFTFQGGMGWTAEEGLTLSLRRGGAVVDSQSIRLETSWNWQFDGPAPAGLMDGEFAPGAGSDVRRLFLGDVEVDSVSIPISGSLPGGNTRPVLHLVGADGWAWIESMRNRSTIEGRLQPGAVNTASVQPHWYHSTLVCLRQDIRRGIVGGRTERVYRAAAYPGGVDLRQWPANPPGSGLVNLYGALNPVTGELALGETQPVSWV